MGRQAFEQTAQGRATFEAADTALGEALTTLIFEGPEERLVLTENGQPAILTTSIALLRGLDAAPDVAAGHSLGEYSAHVAAGTLAFEDAVVLVRKRGRYMQEAVPVGQGAMAAVLGAEDAAVEAACAAIDGVVEPVNYNCPGQLVIAGEAAAVATVSEVVKAAGAKVRPLPVSAPFHSALMRPAEERFAVELREAAFSDPGLPVYVNVDAVPVSSGEGSRDALIRQISRPVRWKQTIERMRADGVELFVEIGPGKALSGMIRRIDKAARIASVQTPDDFEAARAAIAETRG